MPATAAPTPASLVADELLSYLQIRKGPERPELPQGARRRPRRLGNVHLPPPAARPAPAAGLAASVPGAARLRRAGGVAAVATRLGLAAPTRQAALSGRPAGAGGGRSLLPGRPVPAHGMRRRRNAARPPPARLVLAVVGAGPDGGGPRPPPSDDAPRVADAAPRPAVPRTTAGRAPGGRTRLRLARVGGRPGLAPRPPPRGGTAPSAAPRFPSEKSDSQGRPLHRAGLERIRHRGIAMRTWPWRC